MQETNSLPISPIFTPIEWAKWVIEQFQLFEKWLAGARILDPTAGIGNFIFAFLEIAKEKGYDLQQLPLHNLWGVEKDPAFVQAFYQTIQERYQLTFPETNFITSDILFLEKELTADILIGNPPWINFIDLPQAYRQQIKPFFVDYQLFENKKNSLLGGSRIDFANLIVKHCLHQHLAANGEAYFFLPLHLLLNEGANNQFRTYKAKETPFHISQVFDFQSNPIFPKIAARYGLFAFRRDIPQTFPIAFHQYQVQKKSWKQHLAQPIFEAQGALCVMENALDYQIWEDFEKIVLPKASQPRQGVNTCGANDVFIFETYQSLNSELAWVSNAHNKGAILPKRYLFPLISKENFKGNGTEVHKWILMPYHTTTARPLTWEEIEADGMLALYLSQYAQILKNRKGTFIQNWIKKGYWWALLGVGSYCFQAYKIAWESYGGKSFRPILLAGNWQANQAIHAYLPIENETLAHELWDKFQNPKIETYLASLQMQGTCNWAQPGKMKKIFA